MKSRVKRIRFPQHSAKLAELIGIILGDGNLIEFVKAGKGVAYYAVRITGHSEESDYYENYIIPLCRELFLDEPKKYLHKDRKEMFVILCGKMYVEFFKKHGLRPGSKTKSQCTIPCWIRENETYLRACVRGLIDTDGSIYRMDKWVQICFKNFNKKLLVDFRESLLSLGFYASRITHNKVYISRKAHIQKFYKEIGFSNPKHKRRYHRFYSPVV